MQKIQPWLAVVARLGFAAKGTIYVVLGLLALAFAVGFTAEAEDLRGTVETISEQVFGRIVLLGLAFGLVNYGLWNAVQSGWDPERVSTDKVGWGLRVLFGFSALLNFFLAAKTASVGFGWGWGGESGDAAVQSWTARVLGWPGGRWLVILAAVIAAGVAISLVVRLVRGKFMDVFSEEEMERAENLLVKTAARAGFAARTIVALLVAWFLWRAGITADPDEAGGMSKALATLLQQPFGPWLLGATAIGLMAQGLFIWLMVPYRTIRVERSTEGIRERWRRTVGY
mgnify:CR=1 FL=1